MNRQAIANWSIVQARLKTFETFEARIKLTKVTLAYLQSTIRVKMPPFFVANSRPRRHCPNFAEKGCLSSRIRFTFCRFFLGHVACRNLPWQGLIIWKPAFTCEKNLKFTILFQ